MSKTAITDNVFAESIRAEIGEDCEPRLNGAASESVTCASPMPYTRARIVQSGHAEVVVVLEAGRDFMTVMHGDNIRKIPFSAIENFQIVTLNPSYPGPQMVNLEERTMHAGSQ